MRSAAQKLASQVNGAKSRGPKDTSRTRYNGFKHGLCSEHVRLPGEDPAVFDDERDAWFGDWQPITHTRAVLVERAAALTCRLRRAVAAEADTRARDAERAGREFDHEQAARVDRAAARFDDDPMAALTLLESHAAGLDRLLVSWSGLEAALESGPDGWDQQLYHKRLLILTGHLAAESPAGATTGPLPLASARLLGARKPGRSPLPPAEAAEAAEILRQGVAREMDRVRDLRKRAADPAIERARAMRAAGADTTKESQLRHRYEMALDRALRGTIRQLIELERTGADLGEPEPPPDEAPPPEPEAGQSSDVSTEIAANKDVEVSVAASSGSVGADDFVPGSDRPESPSRPSRPRIRPSDGVVRGRSAP